MLSNQARDLSKGFRKIAEWARGLCGRIESACRNVNHSADIFTRKFEDAERAAKEERDKALSQQKKAKSAREDQESANMWWNIFSWVPYVGLVAKIGSVISSRSLKQAEEFEAKANEKIQQARRDLNKKKTQREKAEVIASKIGDLVELLKTIENTTECLAEFWQHESDEFESAAGLYSDIKNVCDVKALASNMAKTSLEELKIRKKELETYHKIMSIVNSQFNIDTKIKPTEFPKIKLPHLQINF